MKNQLKRPCYELGICQSREPACFKCPTRRPQSSWLIVVLYVLMLGIAQHYDNEADKHAAVAVAKREAWAAGRAQGLADAAETLRSGPGLANACTNWWFGGDAKRSTQAISAICKEGVKS